MIVTVEAVYENGMLKVKEPLPFKEQEQVQVTVRPSQRAAAEVTNSLTQSYGIIGWKGSHEELEQILAENEELDEFP